MKKKKQKWQLFCFVLCFPPKLQKSQKLKNYPKEAGNKYTALGEKEKTSGGLSPTSNNDFITTDLRK